MVSAVVAVGGLSVILEAAPASALSSQLTWSTVANVSDTPPGLSQTFNSFNQPSVNDAGVVVFRARTTGPRPVRGIYLRSTQGSSQPISKIGEVGDAVPQPNNSAGTFNEFPSFPRIDATSTNVVTRAQSTPVWTYSTDGGVTNTNEGTSGVYATTGGALETGASLLGNAPGQEIYQVPGQVAGTKFDQFPGAASIDGTTIAFKGNYTAGTSGLTGVFYRSLASGTNAVQLIADSSTVIPNQPALGTVTFGSTAPPSAANGHVVFTGWDNEDAPTLGGIYMASLSPSPALQTLVGIGDAVPGQGAATFTNFGEGVSFDGRYVGFWGTWGTGTQNVTLTCPTDGNADLIAYCLDQYPNGYATTVPSHQGVFVYDTGTSTLNAVTATGDRFSGFDYWVYSGAPPGVGSGEASMEPPRWRAATFVAVSGLSGGAYQVAFKASTVSGSSGIYLAQGPSASERVLVAVQTGDVGSAIDPAAPAGTQVSSLGIERDGFRGRFLAINLSTLDPVTLTSWAGIYVATVPSDLAKENQIVTFSTASPAYIGDQVVLTATSSSDLAVVLSLDASSGAGVCSLSGATLTYVAVGTCVVDANQAGDAAYNAAPQVQVSVDVTLRPQSISFPTPASAYVGDEATLSATASSGLAVTFSLDAVTSACSLSGATLTYLAVGTCVVDANQAGNATYSAASQVQHTLDVTLRPQVISAPAPSNVYVSGSTLLSATADSGLAVSYALNASSDVGACTLTGAMVHFTGIGTCLVDVSQAGDALHAPAATVTVHFTVLFPPVLVGVKVPTTPQVITVPPIAGAAVGASATLGAVTDSGLAVSYSLDPSSTPGVCSVSGSTVTFSAVGTCVIDITQPGDTVFMAAPMVQEKIVVGVMASAIVLSPSVAPARYGQTVRANASVTQTTGVVAGSVQFSLEGHPLGSPQPVVNGLASSDPLRDATGTTLKPGSYAVTATFTPSDVMKYASSSASTSVVVIKAATKLTLVAHPRFVTATLSTLSPGVGVASGTVTFTLAGKVIGHAALKGRVATLRVALSPAKARLLRASYAGNALVGASSARASFVR
jgi:hypothetical protein